MAAAEGLRPAIAQRIGRELKALVQKPPEGIKYLETDGSSLSEIHVELDGPVDTPYEDGAFRLKLVLGAEFPESPPKGFFLTKIYHPNIATSGEICVNTLKRDWTSEVTLSHVLQVIRCLLIVPFPESSLNDEAGRLFMESYDEYAKRARLMVQLHAIHRPRTLEDKNGKGDAVGGGKTDASETAAKRKVAKEQKKQKENKKKGLKRL